MRSLPWLALLLAGLLAALPARAATTCTATAAALNFGTISNAAAGATTTTVAVTLSCSTGAVALLANIPVNACIGVGGTLSPWRTMLNTDSDTMNFQLYNDAGLSQITGPISGSPQQPQVLQFRYSVPVLGGAGSASAQIHAQIPAGQLLASGSYSRPLPITVSYAYNEPLIGAPAMPASCTGPATGTGTATTTLTASATVLQQCGSYLTTDMNFGSISGIGGGVTSNIDQSATLTLTCLKRTAFKIGLDNGQNSPLLSSTRRMKTTVGGADYFLNYELYRDPARSLRWGNTPNVDTLAGTGTGSAQQLTIYGRVPPVSGQPPAGTYSDRVQVTITY